MEKYEIQSEFSDEEKSWKENFDPLDKAEINLVPNFDTIVDKPDEEKISWGLPKQSSPPKLMSVILTYNNETPSTKISKYNNLSKEEKSGISNYASTIELEEVIIWEQDQSNNTSSLDSFLANNKWMLEDVSRFQVIDRYQRNISHSKEKNKGLYTINSVNEESGI
jgi:hypothetical protein